MIIQNSFVDLYGNKKHTLILNKQNIIIMKSIKIKDNYKYDLKNTQSFLQIEERGDQQVAFIAWYDNETCETSVLNNEDIDKVIDFLKSIRK
jgi:hypothetical protein